MKQQCGAENIPNMKHGKLQYGYFCSSDTCDRSVVCFRDQTDAVKHANNETNKRNGCSGVIKRPVYVEVGEHGRKIRRDLMDENLPPAAKKPRQAALSDITNVPGVINVDVAADNGDSEGHYPYLGKWKSLPAIDETSEDEAVDDDMVVDVAEQSSSCLLYTSDAADE